LIPAIGTPFEVALPDDIVGKQLTLSVKMRKHVDPGFLVRVRTGSIFLIKRAFLKTLGACGDLRSSGTEDDRYTAE